MGKRLFKDRVSAGKKLALRLRHLKGQEAVVYALPRGGVVVGAEIARALKVPLDLIITRKIGHPSQMEYAIGAVAENGHLILNRQEALTIDRNYLDREIEKQKQEAKRRRKIYLGEQKPLSCSGKIAILVDDGVATGLTIKAAVSELKTGFRPKKIIAAVPVIPEEAAGQLERDGAEVVAISRTKHFLGAVGAYYRNFPPVEDEEVIGLMQKT